MHSCLQLLLHVVLVLALVLRVQVPAESLPHAPLCSLAATQSHINIPAACAVRRKSRELGKIVRKKGPPSQIIQDQEQEDRGDNEGDRMVSFKS